MILSSAGPKKNVVTSGAQRLAVQSIMIAPPTTATPETMNEPALSLAGPQISA